MNKNNIAKSLASRLHKRGLFNVCTANVVSHKPISKTTARVMVLFNRQPSHAEVASVVGNLLQNKMRVVDKSFRLEGNNPDGTVYASGFVTSNFNSKLLTDEVRASMVEISSNVLMDSVDQSLWDVKQTASGPVITCTYEEDISDLIQMASVRTNKQLGVASTQQASLLEVASPTCAKLVGFVSKDGQLKHGFMVDNGKVLCSDNTVEDEITDDQILQQEELDLVESNVNNGVEVAAPQEVLGSYDAEALKDYYANVFSYSPEYVEALESIIDQHAI